MKYLFILAAIAFLKTVWLYKIYSVLPPTELRRRAKAQPDSHYAAINAVAAHFRQWQSLLWIIGLPSAIFLAIVSARVSWWEASLVILVMIWLVSGAWTPRPGGWSWRVAAWLAPYHLKILEFMLPVLSKLPAAHTHAQPGIYEKDDLLNLIKSQAGARTNRIAEPDLKAAYGALAFNDKTVRDIMVPWAKIKTVAPDETVSPHLMDQLHKAGSQAFVVTKAATKTSEPPEPIGTLYINDVVTNAEGGTVRKLMTPGVEYITDSEPLPKALDKFLDSPRHLLIAQDDAGQITGIVTLEKLLAQIFG